MSRICTLPPHVVALVAAGEVVTTPASVVKELVENCLDAGATQIHVELDQAGLRAIRVRDNGCGMDAEDAALALERHATSKLRTAEDLQAIGSFGFRGEFLASVVAVADVTITTREAAQDHAWEVASRDGTVGPVAPAVRTPGTTVAVEQLFRRVPARLAFLQSATSETNRVVKVLREAALAAPGVGFTLTADGRTLLDAAAPGSAQQRIHQVYGREFADTLAPVAATDAPLTVTGWVSRPECAGRQTRRSTVYVNGRPFSSAELRRIVWQTMKERLAPGTYPEYLLHLTVPPADVDVNVSPDKSAVRFRHAGRVYAVVTAAIRQLLADPIRLAGAPPARHATHSGYWEVPTTLAPTLPVPDRPPAFEGNGDLFAAATDAMPANAVPPDVAAGSFAGWRLPEAPAFLTQVARTFLVAPLDGGMLYIDQHSLHERVCYERLAAATAAVHEQQLLLVPAEIALPSVDTRLTLEEHLPTLHEAGFTIEPSGPDSYWITAVPAWLGATDPARAVARTMEALAAAPQRLQGGAARIAARERVLRTLACHAAVRAGEALEPATIRALWDAGRMLDLALADVHGRPGAIFISHDEIARRLARGALPG